RRPDAELRPPDGPPARMSPCLRGAKTTRRKHSSCPQPPRWTKRDSDSKRHRLKEKKFVMKRAHLMLTLLGMCLWPLAARPADLARIDRKIAKEPQYQHKPKYALAVFGPEAQFKVWLVSDGNVLYVDKNGNGDLTEVGERLVSPMEGGQPFQF